MDRTRIMGIINVTPDSFYEHSRVGDVDGAIARARAMIAEGAEIIDVGGESTRPGATPVPHDLELARVLPVIKALRDEVEISIDTRHGEVAREAVHAGASIINDVSASLEQVAADTGAGWVAMHMRGTPQSMQADPTYDDVVAEVLAYVVAAADRGRALGVERIWIDPGIGFGKTSAHNLALLAAIGEFVECGYPLLLGVSRKRFIGDAHASADAVSFRDSFREQSASEPEKAPVVDPLPAGERLEGSLALATFAMANRASIVRVHDVSCTVESRDIVDDGLSSP